jgi:hypothetical protein
VHQFFPQQREQLDLMNYYVDQMPDPSRYSRRLVDFPLQSYFASIADPSVNHWKKLIVTLVLVLAVVAIGLLIRQSRVTTDPARRTLLLAFAGALGLHVFFHLTIGGTFGFNALDRYIAQANPIVTYALFYGRRLDWKWLALLSIVSVFYAMNLGNGVRSLGFFK